jgi:membrane fusion protein, multidrug efflux system
MKLVSPNRYSAALVEDRAIGTDLGRRFVFVVDAQGVVQYRSVETGRLVEGLRVVTNGLGAGDVVIVNGLQRVRPGVTVGQTRVAMGGDLPPRPQLETAVADEESVASVAF